MLLLLLLLMIAAGLNSSYIVSCVTLVIWNSLLILCSCTSLYCPQNLQVALLQQSRSDSDGSSSSGSSRTYRLTWHKLNTIASRTRYTNYREKN